MVGNHGFADGNKRTTLILLNLLLERSGYRLTPSEKHGVIQKEVKDMILTSPGNGFRSTSWSSGSENG